MKNRVLSLISLYLFVSFSAPVAMARSAAFNFLGLFLGSTQKKSANAPNGLEDDLRRARAGSGYQKGELRNDEQELAVAFSLEGESRSINRKAETHIRALIDPKTKELRAIRFVTFKVKDGAIQSVDQELEVPLDRLNSDRKAFDLQAAGHSDYLHIGRVNIGQFGKNLQPYGDGKLGASVSATGGGRVSIYRFDNEYSGSKYERFQTVLDVQPLRDSDEKITRWVLRKPGGDLVDLVAIHSIAATFSGDLPEVTALASRALQDLNRASAAATAASTSDRPTKELPSGDKPKPEVPGEKAPSSSTIGS